MSYRSESVRRRLQILTPATILWPPTPTCVRSSWEGLSQSRPSKSPSDWSLGHSGLVAPAKPGFVHIHMLACGRRRTPTMAYAITCAVLGGAWPSALAPLSAALCCAPRDRRSASARRQAPQPFAEWALERVSGWRYRAVQSPSRAVPQVGVLSAASCAAVLPFGVRRACAPARL